MKAKMYLLIGGIMLTLVVSAFTIRQTYAATGCFLDTNGNPFEAYICWLKENGISNGTGGGYYSPNDGVTRGQMAAFLQRQHEVPPSTGDILVSSGFSNWQKFFSTDPIGSSNFANGTYLKSSSVGTYTMVLQPDQPVVLYGKSLQLVGVEICYESDTGNLLSEVRVRTTFQSGGLSSSTLRYSDSVDRTDAACRYYLLSSPVIMAAESNVEIFADVTWSTAGTEFGFGRTTFVFQPTSTTAAGVNTLNVQESNNVVILQPADNIPDTSPEAQRP